MIVRASAFISLASPGGAFTLCRMPRRLLGGCWGCVVALLACSEELVEDVPKDVCYSERRWIGGKRGSEEMYPGRDCVGCHQENDGPPLMLGGTLYPYVIPSNEVLLAAQSGEDCFGIEGVTVTIQDENGIPLLEVVTNRAGNFFVEGDPADLPKPFSVRIENFQRASDGTLVGGNATMTIQPHYGGCARCHDRRLPPFDPEIHSTEPGDPNYRFPTSPLGLPGYYEPENYPVRTVQQELEAIARAKGVE